MPTNFPSSDDVFTEPGSPGTTTLSSAGSGTRTHTEHHRDIGDAIEAMQTQATLLAHSHDGSTARHGSKLLQANTHQSPDTDASTSALHHTIGTGANQAAAGTHTHTQANSHNSPDTDSSTSALHHTIGTGANQAAAGNHTHQHPIVLFIKLASSPYSFIKATYPGLHAIEVELVGGGGGSGYAAATGASTYSWGMGGAGGGYVKALILASSLGASETVTIGAGGIAGNASVKDGGTGGTTSFGAICAALGGPGGTDQPATIWGIQHFQAAGGLYTGTYDLGIQGGHAGQNGGVTFGDGWFYNTGGLDGQPSGGPYGYTAKSSYALGQGSSAGSGSPGGGYGSGGEGPFNFPSMSASNGSVGSAGLCIIRLIF